MQSIVQVPARSTPLSSLEGACALHRGLFPMTDGLRQRGMPSSLHTHHHYEKRPPAGAPHEKITVWNTQVPRKLRSLARFRSVRPRNSTDSRRTWPAYGVRDHSRQASPLPPRSDIPVAGCALQNIAAASCRGYRRTALLNVSFSFLCRSLYVGLTKVMILKVSFEGLFMSRFSPSTK